jgi:chemotaxis regulatin CheY-phosphate phosphatase CheZ
MDSVTLPLTGIGGLIVVGIITWAGKAISRRVNDWDESAATAQALKEQSRKWNSHVEECTARRVDHARLEEKVESLRENQSRIESTLNGVNGKIDLLIARD